MDRRWWTLAVICTAVFMLLVDVTVVNVALPQIERSLDASFTELQWVIDAYALSLATVVLNAGSLSDLLGRKRVFLVGIVVFSTASLACGLTPSIWFLIVVRAIQGVGGAILFATSLALINQTFRGEGRGLAFGVWGATAGAAVAFGPLVGGALVTALDWRWVFLINVPLGIGAFLLAWRVVEESRDPERGTLDWPGLVTLSGAVFLVVLALLEVNDQGVTSALVLGCAAGSLALLTAFVVNERRRERPTLDLSLFRIPSFTGVQLAALLISASFVGLFLYLTLYLQSIEGYSAFQAGLRLLPISAVSLLLAPIAGQLTQRVSPRLVLPVGFVLVATGLVLMTRVSADSGWSALVVGFLVVGCGVGLSQPSIANTAVSVAPSERSGMASGTNNTFRQTGTALGIAGLGAIFEASVASNLRESLAGTPLAGRADQLSDPVASGSFAAVLQNLPADVREPVRQAATSAFVESLDVIFLVAAGIAVAGAVLTALLLRGEDLARFSDDEGGSGDDDRDGRGNQAAARSAAARTRAARSSAGSESAA